VGDATPAPTGARRDPAAFSIGVDLRAIRAEPVWWLESAVRLDEAGYAGLWCWDHFMGRGDLTVPVVESWTMLAMAAARTQRVTVAPFVANVMNRHPALLARMAGTLQIASGGRLILGIGIGGAPKEHAAYGIPFPEAPERVRHLEEAVATIRALWTGGPVSRASELYPLEQATAFPVPDPAPRIVIGAETRTGARLAARIGDGWTPIDDHFTTNLPLYLETLEAEGRQRDDPLVLCGFQGANWLANEAVADTEWVRDPQGARERWAAAGADGAIVLARDTADVDALVEAARRW
jgi:alkanesulfonate monooxygenase SsuD/methylene tetrahydromethanopterin reductase-like flavin-dependent oxidoreductase (luciferase family)